MDCLNTIICGDNVEIMRQLPDGCIDLTVTSPPYDLVDYDAAGNLITHSDKGLRDYEGYSWDFAAVAGQLWRVTKPGGVVVWVVGDATEDFCESLTEARQKIYFVDVCGFNLLDTMIYQKINYAPVYPTLKRYAGVFEYMLILCKEKPKTFNPIQVERVEEFVHLGNYLKPNGDFEKGIGFDNRKKAKIKKETKDATNIWAYSVGGDERLHPAIFPESLAADHIKSWSNPGDLVLDPFIGSGTTAKMAAILGRNYLGIDTSENYCNLARRRVGNVERELRGEWKPLIGTKDDLTELPLFMTGDQ